MIMNVRTMAHDFTTSLELDTPPIALAPCDRAPAGVTPFEGSVPSACTFWRRAETAVFYATAAQHFGCPIGALVMGFALPAPVEGELKRLVGLMVEGGYLKEREPARIPALPVKSAGVVYGPLAQFPIDPAFVVLWLTPRQGMLLAEASGTTYWTHGSDAGLLGRPACAALPVAATRSAATVSFGCTGMRTFTEVADDRLLAVIPGREAPAVATALTGTLEANRMMQAFYESRKA